MTIASIKKWFTVAIPAPDDKARAVQLGCHLEEVAEMIEAAGYLGGSRNADALADYLKKRCPGVTADSVDRRALLDALADQIVTAIGVAHMFGMDIEAALAEVDRSNWTKFVDGAPNFDPHGKITKPASYSPPDLSGMY